MTSTNKHVQEIKNSGLTIIRKLYSSNEVSKTLECLERCYKEGVKWAGVPDINLKDKRIYNLAVKDKIFIDFIFKNKILEILKYFLQDPYYRWLPETYHNYILNSSSARSSGNFLDFHIDSGIPFTGQIPLGMVVIAALEKTTRENGATFAITGTHQSGTYTDRTRQDFEYIELDPGDVLIMDSRTWHGAAENIANQSRWTINTHFTQWFIKQDVDIPRSISIDFFDMLNEQEKILLGYCSIPSPGPETRINIKNGLEFLKSIEIKNYIKK